MIMIILHVQSFFKLLFNTVLSGVLHVTLQDTTVIAANVMLYAE